MVECFFRSAKCVLNFLRAVGLGNKSGFES